MDYACEAAAHPGVRHEMMGLGPEHAPYRRLSDLPYSDEPAPSTVAYAAFAGQLCWMIDRFDCDSHMTGDGGDTLLVTPITIVTDLLCRQRWPQAIREMSRWARLRQTSIRRVWRSARAARGLPGLPHWFTDDARERIRETDITDPDLFGMGSHALRDVAHGMAEVGRSAHRARG